MRNVFVFGSNLRGHHGAGAAQDAVHFHGAIEGLGAGPQGASYALPTCTLPGKPLPIAVIELYVEQFLRHTLLVRRASIADTFHITRVGCGFAGYKDAQIAPLFVQADPAMCQFDQSWLPWLGKDFKYWIKT